jgi:8-amino-7-oxononanoate synthase
MIVARHADCSLLTTATKTSLDVVVRMSIADLHAGTRNWQMNACKQYSSFADIVLERATTQPDRIAYTFVQERGLNWRTVTYGEVARGALAVAGALDERGLAGERVLLLHPPGFDFIIAYYGCLLAGATAVPCYPPGLTRASSVAVQRIASDSGARAVLTVDAWRADARLASVLAHERHLTPSEWIATDRLGAAAGEVRRAKVDSGAIAFLQYTSGSTGDPKGVVVTHGNLLHNTDLMRRAFELTAEDHVVSWLPPYHDMGLIGTILGPMYGGCPATLMAPATFLRQPLFWLEVISRQRASITGGPNFGYDMCIRALRKQKGALELDLGCWRMAFNGAEIVRVETMRRFAKTFEGYGLRREALAPCYGLAEATLLAATAPVGRGMKEGRYERGALEREGQARLASGDDERVRVLAGCGVPAAGMEVRIVDTETRRPCAEREVGEVWIRGESVARGYWGRPDLTREVFGATIDGDLERPFLRTGDRGFLDGGELYVTGRLKDVIIVRGRKLSAEDLEESVRYSHPALKPYRCLAMAVEEEGEERLVVTVECEARVGAGEAAARKDRLEEVWQAIRSRLVGDHGVELDRVLVLAPGATPITTSGKLRRRACREAYLAGRLAILVTLGHPPAAAPADAAPAGAAPAIAADLPPAALPPAATPAGRDVVAVIQSVVRKRTGKRLDPGDTLSKLGIDSLAATELALELEDALGISLPPALLTPDLSLHHIAARIAGDGASPIASASPARDPSLPANASAALAAAGGAAPADPETPRSFPERLALHQRQLRQLQQNGLLCYGFAQQRMRSATELTLGGDEVVVFSSYSYLGLNGHPDVSAAKIAAIHRYGTGAHAVMLLGGYTDEHRALERQIARNFQAEAALLYSSGYAANMAVIDALMRDGGSIFCDRLVHTSILDGCRISGAQVHMFPHQDADALDRMLGRRRDQGRALVIVDGVYSLRGEIADLPALARAAHANEAILMVDEAHALGAVGPNGRGTAEHHDMDGQVDVTTGGLGKGVPAYGGYVAARRELVEFLRFRSNQYVYSGGMDVSNVAAARAALVLLASDPSIMGRLRRNIALMQGLLAERRIPSLRWDSPCMPVVCGDAERSYAASAELRRRGFYVAPIVYPAVPKDQQGLRLTVTAAHTSQQIHACVDELERALRLVGVALPPRPRAPVALEVASGGENGVANGTTGHATACEKIVA